MMGLLGRLLMFNTKTEREIQLIKESALIVGKTLAEVAKVLRPGISTKELDVVAEKYIRSCDAIPACKGYYGFPATLCISVNDVVVHGIPGDYKIKDGDIVSVDCVVLKNGYHGDYAYTFMVGNVAEDVQLLVKRTKESLYKGIEAAVCGNRVGDIGYAIQTYVEGFGYSVVRELTGHGIGKSMHEKPSVTNYGQRGTGSKLNDGMVICIEPMINLGARYVDFDEKDGWTVRTQDRKPSAHFEHQVVIRKTGTEVVSTYEFLEKEIEKNSWIS